MDYEKIIKEKQKAIESFIKRLNLLKKEVAELSRNILEYKGAVNQLRELQGLEMIEKKDKK